MVEDSTNEVKEKAQVNKVGNVLLTCRADILADLCGVSISDLTALFDSKGVSLKYITDFNSSLYAEVAENDEGNSDCKTRIQGAGGVTYILDEDGYIIDEETGEIIEIDTISEDSIFALLSALSFMTPLEISERVLKLKIEDIVRIAKEHDITLGYIDNAEYALKEFIEDFGDYYSLLELSELFNIKPSILRKYVKDNKIKLDSKIDIVNLGKFLAVVTEYADKTLKEVAEFIGCSLCMANEFARLNKISIRYKDTDKKCRATLKALEAYLEDKCDVFEIK